MADFTLFPINQIDLDKYSEDGMIELIVKYNGDIRAVAAEVDAFVEILDSNYSIFTLPIDNIPTLYSYNEVEYIELPKSLTYFLRDALNSSCIAPVQRQSSFGLTGNGVLIGIIDSGLDYTHPDFRNEDGTTRVLYLWDQLLQGTPPEGFRNGAEFTKEQIDRALNDEDPYSYVPSKDLVGHGTAVAGIAAGNGRSSDKVETGVAPNASLIIVKLGHKGNVSFTRSTEIMRAVKYISDRAEALGMPVSINISYGTNNGSHLGDSLFETYLDSVAEDWKSSISVASGNEGSSGHHYSKNIFEGEDEVVEFSVSENIPQLYLTIWKNFADDMTFEVIAPSGKSTGIIPSYQRVTKLVLDNVIVTVLYGQPNNYNLQQEIYILFTGINGPVSSGLWNLVIRGVEIICGIIDIWLPTLEEASQYTSFLRPTTQNTITLPATALNVISVGGYNSTINSITDFTGRGTMRNINYMKPDLVAPAVNILTTRTGGGYDTFTGTSVAAPFVAGSAALMMEWGILRQNDPFLYGQRIKAFLRKGASRKDDIIYPNPIWGYGSLNLCDTMEQLVEYNQLGGAFL